jgi:Uma2 family endonuclease
MTLEEWAELEEDESGELVDGFLEEEEVPDLVHELLVTWLTTLCRVWPAGVVGSSSGRNVRIQVSPRRGRRADAVVFLPGGAVPPRRGLIKTPPDIVVEVVTPTPRDERRDRIDKFAEYEALGVRYYWLVDPALGTLEIFELGEGGRFTRSLAASTETLDAVPGCAGLVLSMTEMWAEIDRLGPEV